MLLRPLCHPIRLTLLYLCPNTIGDSLIVRFDAPGFVALPVAPSFRTPHRKLASNTTRGTHISFSRRHTHVAVVFPIYVYQLLIPPINKLAPRESRHTGDNTD